MVFDSSSITDALGVAFADGTVTASDGTNTLDTSAPTVSASSIGVNNSVQPNVITIQASEKLDKTTAETAGNWLIKDNTLGVTYDIATASLTNDTVILTLAAVDSADSTTL